MFTICGGNTEFNQWDLNQRVVEPRLVAGDKVIFLNSSGMTYPMKAYSHNGEVVVDVPNIILTKAVPMVVYINGHYETRTSFNVVAQDKPEDYVFVDNDDWPSDNSSDSSKDSGGLNLPILDLRELIPEELLVQGAEVPEKQANILNQAYANCLPVIFQFPEDDGGGYGVLVNWGIEETNLGLPGFTFTFADLMLNFIRGDSGQWAYFIGEAETE